MAQLTEDKIKKLIGKKRCAMVEAIYFDGSDTEVITVEMAYPVVNESTIHVFEFSIEDTQKTYLDDLKWFLDTAKEDPTHPAWRNYK